LRTEKKNKNDDYNNKVDCSQYAGEVGAEKRSKGRGWLVSYKIRKTKNEDNNNKVDCSQYAGEVGAVIKE